MADGTIMKSGTYSQLLDSCKELQNLVIALSDTSGSNNQATNGSQQGSKSLIQEIDGKEHIQSSLGEQLIKKEEREAGDTGLKIYKQYLIQSNGFFYFFLSLGANMLYIMGHFSQNLWLANQVQYSSVNWFNMWLVYMVIAVVMMLFLILRSFFVVKLRVKTSIAVFPT